MKFHQQCSLVYPVAMFVTSAEYDEDRGRFEAINRRCIDVIDGFEREDFATVYHRLLE